MLGGIQIEIYRHITIQTSGSSKQNYRLETRVMKLTKNVNLQVLSIIEQLENADIYKEFFGKFFI